jgi:hypothetical protein
LFEKVGLLLYFTNWAFEMSLVSSLLTLSEIAPKHANLICFEIAAISNVAVVVGYWGLVHDRTIDGF